LQIAALGEIEAARVHLASALDNRRVLDAREREDQENLRLLEARLHAGASDRLELLDAKLLSLQAERLRLDAEGELFAAVAELEKAVQRPLWPESQLLAPAEPDDPTTGGTP